MYTLIKRTNKCFHKTFDTTSLSCLLHSHDIELCVCFLQAGHNIVQFTVSKFTSQVREQDDSFPRKATFSSVTLAI